MPRDSLKLAENTKESPRSRSPAAPEAGTGRRGGSIRGRTALPLAFGLVVATAGCGTYRSLRLPERPAHTLSNRVERRGLTVAARGYLEPDTAARYFTAELWEAGYFPVVFHFENRGTGTFEVERRRITISRESRSAVDASESPPEPLTPRPLAEIVERCRRSSAPAYLLVPLFVFPAIWARGEIEGYNFELTKDLEGKALPGYYRLEPESPLLRGAVFFSRPEGEPPLAELLKGAELRLKVMIEGSRIPASENSDTPTGRDEARVGETLTFILPLTSVGE